MQNRAMTLIVSASVCMRALQMSFYFFIRDEAPTTLPECSPWKIWYFGHLADELIYSPIKYPESYLTQYIELCRSSQE